MRLLLVEDEPHARQALARALTEEGMQVVTADDGPSGLRMALESSFDCLILDVMLPGISGFAIVDALRDSGVSTPVLFLTARGSLPDRLRGLRSGGDYVVKPCAVSELLLRVRNLTERTSPGFLEPGVLEVGDLQLLNEPRRASRQGIRLDLTQQEFLLLCLLARNAGKVVTRSRIAEELWELDYESDPNLVDAAIRRLRRKVDDPFPARLIHTHRGVGYCLDADRKPSP